MKINSRRRKVENHRLYLQFFFIIIFIVRAIGVCRYNGNYGQLWQLKFLYFLVFSFQLGQHPNHPDFRRYIYYVMHAFTRIRKFPAHKISCIQLLLLLLVVVVAVVNPWDRGISISHFREVYNFGSTQFQQSIFLYLFLVFVFVEQ